MKVESITETEAIGARRYRVVLETSMTGEEQLNLGKLYFHPDPDDEAGMRILKPLFPVQVVGPGEAIQYESITSSPQPKTLHLEIDADGPPTVDFLQARLNAALKRLG